MVACFLCLFVCLFVCSFVCLFVCLCVPVLLRRMLGWHLHRGAVEWRRPCFLAALLLMAPPGDAAMELFVDGLTVRLDAVVMGLVVILY
mmetsp:Transcript_88851/g.251812  ORF Transcript_88851/g.251812 Transcript_88851/m.251812 type:complete len:89 (+) Transcript_88851:1258-1524(+)